MTTHAEAVFLGYAPCPACRERGRDRAGDNLAIYSDGHGHCFACGHRENEAAPASATPITRKTLPEGTQLAVGSFQDIASRNIREDTCRKFGYRVGEYKGKKCHLADIYNTSGEIIGQKIRLPGKKFVVKYYDGHADDPEALFGRFFFRDGGRKVTVTTGEIDAMSVAQAFDLKYPVHSLLHGDDSAAECIAANLDYLLKFDEVVLMFDDDESGKEALEQVLRMFPPGKAKVATLGGGFKDANEALKARANKAIVEAVYAAREYRPDGIITAEDCLEEALANPDMGFPWFCPELTKATYGRHLGQTMALGAGTGVGKTDFITQQVAFDLTDLKEPVAVFFLEQPPGETLRRVSGKIAGRRFHLPNLDGELQRWTQEERREALTRLAEDHRLYLYRHFGQADWGIIEDRIRFLYHSVGVRLFYVDHLTALADPQSEKTSLEEITSSASSLAQELMVNILFVSHLATPEGKPHEEGGRVMIRHFKGSRSIGFWSHVMVGLERNQQHEAKGMQTVLFVRLLKERVAGETGKVLHYDYDRDTGRYFYISPERVRELQDAEDEEEEGCPPYDETL